MTINDPKAVRDVLLSDGMLEDIQFYDIFSYVGIDNKTHFALFAGEIPDMNGNPYVKSYEQLLLAGKLTDKGKLFAFMGM